MYTSGSLFSHSVMSDSLWPHGLQQARPPCPSPTPRACSNSCPSSRWCHPTISSSVVPFSSCLQSLPTLGSFPMSPFFTSGSQNVRVSASASEKAMVMNVLSEIKVERSFKKIIDHNQDLSPNRFYSFLSPPSLLPSVGCGHPTAVAWPVTRVVNTATSQDSRSFFLFFWQN